MDDSVGARSIAEPRLLLIEGNPLDPALCSHPLAISLKDSGASDGEPVGIVRLKWRSETAFQMPGDCVDHDHLGVVTRCEALRLADPVKALEEHEEFVVR